LSKSIAVFNQKGGVGKTTTVINLSACLSNLGKKVLMIDIDPQGNTTSGVGIDKNSLKYTIYDILINNISPRDCILPVSQEGLFLIPASVQLAGAEIELTTLNQRELKLRDCIKKIKDDFDFIFVDCPPSLGLLSVNALSAVDSVLIPIQCEYYALEGLSQLMNTVKLVQRHLNPGLDVEGVVLTMFDARTNLSMQVVEDVKQYFRNKVYRTIIPRNVRLSEAPSFGLPIILYDPKSKGAECYLELAQEVIDYSDGGNR
jgi:chromosome partitioning protein